MRPLLTQDALDVLFRKAHTHRAWSERPVDDALLREAYDLAKLGPTSANMCPLRITFVRSAKAKEALETCLAPGHVDLSAPVIAIFGMEVHFYKDLPRLFPQADARPWFEDIAEERLEYIALRNSSLQAAYFMLAARALGLDCGPRSRLDPDRVNATFFGGETIKCNFLCCLGYGEASSHAERGPRFNFDEVCHIL